MGVEDMYWTLFQTVRFGVHLSGNFSSQLIIPKKFTEKVRKRFPDKVSLRGPAGESHNWEVELNTNNNATSLVGESWKDFVTTYGLKENDFLLFKYKNNSYFKVLIFDGQSCWVEKESSYFVAKSDAPRIECVEETKQQKVANSREDSPPQAFTDRVEESDQLQKIGDARERVSQHNMSTEVFEGRVSSSSFRGKSLQHVKDVLANSREESPPQVFTGRNEESDQLLKRGDSMERVFKPCMSRKIIAEDSDEVAEVIKQKKDDREWRPSKKLRVDECNIQDTPEGIRNTASRKALDWPRKMLHFRQGSSYHHSSRKQPNPRRKSPTASYQYLTQKHEILGRKREPTDTEKERAKQLAHQELTEDSFLIVMTPSTVGKRFRLTLPKAWTDKFMPGCHQDVILHLNDQDSGEWRLRYNFDRKRCSGQIIGGWNHFVHDNALHEFDACVFKIAGRKQGNVCMDVKIFRVTEGEDDQPLVIDRVTDRGQEKDSTGEVVVGLKSMTSGL